MMKATKLMMLSAPLLILLAAETASAQKRVITNCIGPEGYSYFAEGGLVSTTEAGWTEGAVSKGSFILTKDGDEYDIIFTDATSRTISSRDDGGRVVALRDAPGTLVLLVAYPINVEVWTFKIDGNGNGYVMQSLNRFDPPSPIAQRYSLMRARCSR